MKKYVVLISLCTVAVFTLSCGEEMNIVKPVMDEVMGPEKGTTPETVR